MSKKKVSRPGYVSVWAAARKYQFTQRCLRFYAGELVGVIRTRDGFLLEKDVEELASVDAAVLLGGSEQQQRKREARSRYSAFWVHADRARRFQSKYSMLAVLVVAYAMTSGATRSDSLDALRKARDPQTKELAWPKVMTERDFDLLVWEVIAWLRLKAWQPSPGEAFNECRKQAEGRVYKAFTRHSAWYIGFWAPA